jgi:hypothetical protein
LGAGLQRGKLHRSLEAGVGAQQFDIEQVAEIGFEGMHRQVHHVHRTLRAHRVQADGAAVAQTPRLGAARADARAHLQRRRFLAVQREVLQCHPQSRDLEGSRPRVGRVVPAQRAALEKEIVDGHFPGLGRRCRPDR